MTRRLVSLGAAVVVAVALVIVVRTLSFTIDAPPVPPASPISVRPGAADRLAGAIRIPTIATDNPGARDEAAFRSFGAYLEAQFPELHRSITREQIEGGSLLYRWQGTEPSQPAMLLMGHIDVVGVEAASQSLWTHPPFSGAVADGFIWGRGALDDKSSVLAVLESVQNLLTDGFRPRRTVYLAFGHDEETGGADGAARMAALLKARGVRLDLVLDEGGVIAEGLFPGVTIPVALVGVAEKGVVNIELVVHAAGGHASMPPRHTAIGALAAAVTRLESTPLPARLDGPTRALFDRVGPLLPLASRAALANLWLARPVVLRQLTAVASMNAAVRTTLAVTMADAGVKENVLPTRARAVVNARILPGDTVADVLEHVRRVVGDAEIAVAPIGTSWEASPVSAYESGMFRAVDRVIRQVIPDAVVAPYLVPGATDARHYQSISASVFRLLPVRLTASDIQRLHGVDERVGVEDYERAIGIMQRLIQDVAGPGGGTRADLR